MRTIENIFYTKRQHPEQVLDVHLPDCDRFPVLVWLHEGGLINGDKKIKMLDSFVEKGIAVVSANYRMYPEAVYPEFICDAAAAVAWAKKNMPQYGEVTGLFIGGSSAGGYLTQMLCFDRKYLKIHSIDADQITGYIMDAGQPTTHFNVLKERGIDSRRVIIDEAAPIYHITAGRDYAPMQIFVAANDMRNRLEQTQLLISTLKCLGCDESKIDYQYMPGYKHIEYQKCYDNDGNNILVEAVVPFMQKCMDQAFG